MKIIIPVLLAVLFCALFFLIYKEETSLVEFRDTGLPVKGKSWQKVRLNGYETRVLELEHGWLVQDHGITCVPKPDRK